MQCNHKRIRLPATATILAWGRLKVRTLHRNEEGTISVLSVVALLMLTMLLGMILNVGEQIDDKIKAQNAADAATYSSGVVIARGLNTIAFTNHLLSETFALTAYLREGRDRYAESISQEVLSAWETFGEQVGQSEFQLIRDMQPAVSPKIQMERQLLQAFGDMTATKARLVLPALEAILGIPENLPPEIADNFTPQEIAESHLIPTFQRTIVLVTPDVSDLICQEIALRNLPKDDPQLTKWLIWSAQSDGLKIIQQYDPVERMLPALDPSVEGPDYQYLSSGEIALHRNMARRRRDDLARHYLAEWINDDSFDLGPFERETLVQGGRVSAKKSQFINFFRGFTCAKLKSLLEEEFPNTNYPHILRQPLSRTDRATYEEYRDEAGHAAGGHFHAALLSQQKYLDLDFTFAGFIYRSHRRPIMPGMYHVPIKGDSVAFARVSVYLPRPRYRTQDGYPIFHCPVIDGWSGDATPVTPCYDPFPIEWSLFSQNWAARMIPSSSALTASVLNTYPENRIPGLKMPQLGSVTVEDLNAINFH